MLLEFAPYIQSLLDWNARYFGIVGWVAILCGVLSVYAAFTVAKSEDLRTIRSGWAEKTEADSVIQKNREQKNDDWIH